MATTTEKADLNVDQENDFQNKLQRIKAGLHAESPTEMIEFAMQVTPLGVEKVGASALKELGTKVAETAKHLPETLQALKANLPQGLKDAMPQSARDLAHLMFTPQNPSPIRRELFEKAMENGEATRAAKMQIATVPYASITYGGSSLYAASKVIDYANSDERHYESYASRFLTTATENYKQVENLTALKKTVPELEKPIDTFLAMQNKLAADGTLSNQDKAAMALVAKNFSEIIRTEGPKSPQFDTLQNTQTLSH